MLLRHWLQKATKMVPAKTLPALPAKALPAKALPAKALPAKALPAKALPALSALPAKTMPASPPIVVDEPAAWRVVLVEGVGDGPALASGG